jgi:hypothetical protein
VVTVAYADKAEVTLTNSTAAPAWVQTLRILGRAVRTREPATATASDGTSRAAYQTRKLALDAPLMDELPEAQRLADHLLAAYKDPDDEVAGVGFLANGNATLLAAARDLELLDRVVVSEGQTGLDDYAGYITQMRHEIRSKFEHRVTLALATAYTVGTPFRLDTSALNSGHVLIY